MRKITIKDIDYLVPGTWDEMTAEQLCFLANILNSKSTAQEAKVKMLLFCLSARIRRYQKANGTGYAVSLPKDRIWITAEQLAALSTIFDFLFQETEKGIELDIRLTRNPFPVYKGKDIELYGPEDGLTNISYGQFIMLQTWQQRMRQDFFEALDNFLSIIWKDGSFSIREDGDPAWFRNVEPIVKTVMFWYYLGSMNFIQAKFSRVFSSGGNEAPWDIFDTQQRIVDEMASGDVTKKEQVKQSLLYDALYTLEVAIEKEEKKKQDM